SCPSEVLVYVANGLYLIFFFFFQAEDGIRDGHVTGVQTCALPIFEADPASEYAFYAEAISLLADLHLSPPGDLPPYDMAVYQRRSEERRVGKECRSRWGEEQ